MKKFSQRFISMLIVLSLMSSLLIGTASAKTESKGSVSESTVSISDRISTTDEKIKESVSENSVIKNDGMSIINEDKIIKKLDSLDLSQLQKDAESKGAVFSEPLNTKSLMKKIKEGIKSLNKRIEKKELKVLKNGTIIESNDDNFYIQGGTDREEHYWWGIRDYFCTNCAWGFQATMYKCALAIGTVGSIGGLLTAGTAAIIGLAGAAYYTNVAIDIGYWNSISTRGIVVDFNYWLTYSMRGQ